MPAETSIRIAEAAFKLRVPRYHIYYWKKTGLLSEATAGRLQFEDLLKIRFIQRCRSSGLSLQKIRRIVSMHGQAGSDWHRELELAPGGALLARDPAGFVHPDSGQIYFSFSDIPSDVVSLSDRRAQDQTEEPESPGALIQQLEAEYLAVLESGDYRRIRSALDALIQAHPEHLAAHIELGNLCFEFNRYDEAMEIYDAALEMDPECVEAHYNVANIHFKERRYAAAIRYFQNCIALDPEFPEAYYNLGLLYYSLKYFQPAVACLEAYLSLDPDSSWSDQARQLSEDMQAHLVGAEQSDNFSLFGKNDPHQKRR